MLFNRKECTCTHENTTENITIMDSVKVTSSREPQCNERHRSSKDFKVDSKGTYKISVSATHNPKDIKFKIGIAKTAWFDSEIKGTFKDGDTVKLSKGTKYYIMDPLLAFSDFTVTFKKQ